MPDVGCDDNSPNGLGMAAATTFVLICSSVLISMLKRVIPAGVRIPAYIVVIATFVTTVDYYVGEKPELHQALGVFIPLIVVNCIILGRAEAYASKMPVHFAAIDAWEWV